MKCLCICEECNDTCCDNSYRLNKIYSTVNTRKFSLFNAFFYKFKEIKKKDWEKHTSEESKFYDEWSTKFSEDYGSTTEDKELKYLEPGDYFEDDRILMVSIKEKYVVTMTDYGNIRIYIINSCYSTSKATGLVNYEL